MALFLYRLGKFSYRRHWLVISLWLAALVAVGGSATFHGTLSNNFQIPGTETQRIADKLKEDLPSASGGTATIVFEAPEGIAVAALVLIIMLGTLVAAGLPLLMAVVGVGVGVGTTFALSGLFDMSSISPMLALMLGLAVGIDYSLFIVNRHRTQLLAGMDAEESVARATGTSGNAVVFAGLTVIIALAALVVPGLPFLAVMGLAAAGTVAVAVLVAITLTPAMLSLIGRRIISRRAWAKADAHNAEPGHVAADEAADRERSTHGWGGLVTRHPVLALLAGVVLLGTLALPATQLQLALPDGGSEPVESEAYQAYDLTARSFGEGVTGPIVAVGEFPANLDEAQAQALQYDVADKLRAVDNVVAAVPVALSEDRRTAVFQVIPEEGPASASTVRVVSELRGLNDEIQSEYNVAMGLTGQTAGNIDVSTKLGEALPPYLAIVVGLSLVLLLLVFRSNVVPLLATGGFLLSLAAAFGAVVAVYQWAGWGACLTSPTPARS